MPMIKKKLLVCVLFVIVAIGKANGQDIIFYKNGTKDSVKIVEIGEETVSFKKYKRLNGPLYVVPKLELKFIEFENGRIHVLDSTSVNENKSSQTHIRYIGNNILMVNMFSIVLGNIQLGYEMLTNDGKVGYKASILASVLSEQTKISMLLLGLDVNLYSSGQKWVSHYVGPAIRYGYVDYYEEGFNPSKPFVACLINNGFTFNAGNSFYTAIQIGVGSGFYESKIFPYGYLTLNLGGRF